MGSRSYFFFFNSDPYSQPWTRLTVFLVEKIVVVDVGLAKYKILGYPTIVHCISVLRYRVAGYLISIPFRSPWKTVIWQFWIQVKGSRLISGSGDKTVRVSILFFFFLSLFFSVSFSFVFTFLSLTPLFSLSFLISFPRPPW